MRGFARNLADGSVEVFAQGEPAAVRAMSEWLKLGPPQARVDAVEDLEPAVELVAQLPRNFQVR